MQQKSDARSQWCWGCSEPSKFFASRLATIIHIPSDPARFAFPPLGNPAPIRSHIPSARSKGAFAGRNPTQPGNLTAPRRTHRERGVPFRPEPPRGLTRDPFVNRGYANSLLSKPDRVSEQDHGSERWRAGLSLKGTQAGLRYPEGHTASPGAPKGTLRDLLRASPGGAVNVRLDVRDLCGDYDINGARMATNVPALGPLGCPQVVDAV